MTFVENIRIALTALAANKLRAALTMLGIMIGVAAVITLLAIGDGVQRYIADRFIGLGTNLVFIVPQQEEPGRPGSDPLVESSLTLRDAIYLNEPGVVPGAENIVPVILGSRELQYEGTYLDSQIAASTPEYGPLRGYAVARGRSFDLTDYNLNSRVVVIGSETADLLFPDDVEPVGSSIRIRGFRFEVIGVLEPRGGGVFGSQDAIVLMPLTTAQERIFNKRSQRTGEQLVDLILMQAIDASTIDGAIIDASEALRQRHNIAFRDDDDFGILTQQDFLDAFGAVTGVLTLFLGAIASISLLVGGIGIMNIMLVSVTERTREIGLRKAVGARNNDILGQFLFEAIFLALAGGVAGIVLGLIGTFAVRLAVPDLEAAVTVSAVAIAVGFSALIGIFFGIFPASRAARLNPIDALRFE